MTGELKYLLRSIVSKLNQRQMKLSCKHGKHVQKGFIWF